jgi:hypothetical protein
MCKMQGALLTTDIGTPRYPLLIEALRLLPGIGPHQERARLGEAKYRASRSASLTADFNGVKLALARLQELFVCDQRGRPRVSPAGATLLLELYDRGAFTSRDERREGGNLEVLAQYSKGLATVVALNHRQAAKRKPRAHSGSGALAKRSRETPATNRPPAAPIANAPLMLFRALIHRLD